MAHPLGSPYVRDQLSLRAVPVNQKRAQPEGEYVLYWMQCTQRLDDNWALRYATSEADRLGRPLVVVQEIDAAGEHATARRHRFALDGAADVARQAEALGVPFRLSLPRRRADAGRAIARLARRATIVVTDDLPTGGVRERTRAIAERAECRVVAVDSAGVVPAACFAREEYAARTIRPKLMKLLELCLEPVEDRAPRRTLRAGVLSSMDAEWLDPTDGTAIARALAECEVDHDVRPVTLRGGREAALARLRAFVGDGLRGYTDRRRDPSDPGGSSRLSPYLHFGQISPAAVVRAVQREAPPAEAESFVNEMVVWRELSLNFCWYNAAYRTLDALPEWARKSMAEHEEDERASLYSVAELERAETHDELWNAAQRELIETGTMHNFVRMLWGKSVLTWTRTFADALAVLIHLNDRYALDGCDPNSYAGIQWCFGKFDRPFSPRPVWGTIRPMSLDRARKRPGVPAYVQRWSGAALELLAEG